MSRYGQPPEECGNFDQLRFSEFMTYVYLPVRFPGTELVVPDRLMFLRPMLSHVARREPDDTYLYLTAKHGYATLDNPLNRPGWHCDGFGTDDVNYVWWDRWGTRFAVQEFTDISDDHVQSQMQFEAQVHPKNIRIYPTGGLYRLDPFVVHTTPVIDPPGGMRSFVKVSVSRHRYNLQGNSHNYLIPYRWRMHPRDVLRNDPTRAQLDFVQ